MRDIGYLVTQTNSRYDSLAQLVEHLTFNPVVPSSNLGWVTTSGHGGIGRRARLRI